MELKYRKQGKYVISTILLIMSLVLFLTLCHDTIILNSTHEHRLRLMKEKDSIYQMDKNLHFDISSRKYNRFLDSMRVVVYKDLEK